MSQKVQIIIRVPERRICIGSPDNRHEQVFVSHNKVMHPARLVVYAAYLMRAIAKLLADADTGRKTYPQDYEDLVRLAIGYADHNDLDWLTTTTLYNTAMGNDHASSNVSLRSAGSALEFVKGFDNDNGFLFIDIADDSNILFGLLKSPAGDDGFDDVSVDEYLCRGGSLHLLKMTGDREDLELYYAIRKLAGYGRAYVLKTLSEIRRRLNEGS